MRVDVERGVGCADLVTRVCHSDTEGASMLSLLRSSVELVAKAVVCN